MSFERPNSLIFFSVMFIEMRRSTGEPSNALDVPGENDCLPLEDASNRIELYGLIKSCSLECRTLVFNS